MSDDTQRYIRVAAEAEEAQEPERTADTAGEAFRLLRERRGTPMPERPGARHGVVLGPIRSLGASWDHQRESAKAWGEVHPVLQVVVMTAGIIRMLFHLPAHCWAYVTESNARFYGTILAAALTALTVLIITLAH